jgi:hypothetical protein
MQMERHDCTCGIPPQNPMQSASPTPMNSLVKLALGAVFAVSFGHTALAQYPATFAPQGRLTLNSIEPVMASDVVNTSTIYYVPYVGNQIPIYNPTPGTFPSYTFVTLTLTLNSSQAAGNIYDIFAFLNSGAVTLGCGPAWTNSTTRSTATTLWGGTQFGLATNNNAITLTNGSNTYTGIYAGAATYLGSVYMTAAGETSVMFNPSSGVGGSGTVIGLWNAYHRVRVTASSADSTATWTYSSSTWRNADNSASNSITWLDGGGGGGLYGETSVSAAYDVVGSNSSASGSTNIGVGINSIVTPAINAQVSNTTALITMHAATLSPPILGLNVAQAIERVTAGTETFYGVDLLTLDTEY